MLIAQLENNESKMSAIENLSKIISKLPGLGPRSAKRMILYLANNKDKILLPLITQLQNLYENTSHCKVCGNLDQGNICGICNDVNRDETIICVVEEVADLWAIERGGNYKGKYHVLGGNLSAMSGKTIEELNIANLNKRLEEGSVKELIIATSATIDGQTTAHFLADNLKKFDVKITRLAYGIPVGSELDYLDEGTIEIAFKSRSNF